MKDFKIKLKSESGKTLLIAMVFFLVCIVTASTLLAGAASHSGKAPGGEDRQKESLALSSAIKLVCDEITAEGARYQGQYTYTAQVRRIVMDEPDWQVVSEKCEQTRGTFENCGMINSAAPLLVDQLDLIFAKQSFQGQTGDGVQYKSRAGLPLNIIELPFVLSLEGGAEEYKDLGPVHFTLLLQDNCDIELTAVMGDEEPENAADAHRISALLKANTVPRIASKPGVPESLVIPEGAFDSVFTSPYYFSTEVTWKLDHISYPD